MRTRTFPALIAFVLALVPTCDKPEPAEDYRFQRTYGGPGGDFGYSVQQTADGGYILAGATGSVGSYEDDFYLVKTDARGDTEWTRTFTSPGHDYYSSACQAADGGYVALWSWGYSHPGIRLAKTDTAGNTMWTRVYGDSSDMEGSAIEPTRDGGFIIVGSAHSPGSGDQSVLFLRTDAAGETLWTATVGDEYGQSANAVQQTADGGYVAVGATVGYGWNDDCYIVKVDAYGTLEWVSGFGGEESDRLESVRQTTDRGYIAVGTTYCTPGEDADVYLVRFDSDGETLWTRRFGGSGYDIGRSLDLTEDGGFIVAGVTESFGAGASDVYLIRADSDGDALWTRTFGAAGDDWCSAMCRTADSGFAIVGSTDLKGTDDVFLIKTDAIGATADSLP